MRIGVKGWSSFTEKMAIKYWIKVSKLNIGYYIKPLW
jgi:hypothetical protein